MRDTKSIGYYYILIRPVIAVGAFQMPESGATRINLKSWFFKAGFIIKVPSCSQNCEGASDCEGCSEYKIQCFTIYFYHLAKAE